MVIDISQNILTQMSTVIELNGRKCGVILSDPGSEWGNSKILWGPDEQLVRLIVYYGSEEAKLSRKMTVSGRWVSGGKQYCFYQNYLSTDGRYLSLQKIALISV